MEEYESSWERTKESIEVPLYGTAEPAPDPGPLQTGRMVSGFKQGVRDLLPLWELILSQDTLGQILTLDMQAPEDFRFPPALWVQTVYDFALAYHDQTLHQGAHAEVADATLSRPYGLLCVGNTARRRGSSGQNRGGTLQAIRAIEVLSG